MPGLKSLACVSEAYGRRHVSARKNLRIRSEFTGHTSAEWNAANETLVSSISCVSRMPWRFRPRRSSKESTPVVTSPYSNKPVAARLKITKGLLVRHPLTTDVILEVATQAWGCLWNTRVGVGKTAVELNQLDVPATVVGYFFEVLFTNEMERRFPGKWRGCKKGDEKDLVYIPDPRLSVEIKTSGQLGLKVFGNRSYGQKGPC